MSELPNTAESLSNLMESMKAPQVTETEYDLGQPIRPLTPLPNGTSQLMIITLGAAGQPLPFSQVYFSWENQTYGPYVSDMNGVIVISNVKGGRYLISGFYKGFKSEKLILLPEGEARLYELTFPVFIEIGGVPLTFGAFPALMVGVILLIIIIVVIISEYIRWKARKLRIYPV